MLENIFFLFSSMLFKTKMTILAQNKAVHSLTKEIKCNIVKDTISELIGKDGNF